MTVETELDKLLRPYITSFNAQLTTELEGEMADIYIEGSTQVMTWGKSKKGIPIPFEGPPSAEAIAFAKEHCATMITEMSETTQSQIANSIGRSIQGKRGIEGMQRDLRYAIKGMTEGDEVSISRARMIARTESNTALSQSFLDTSIAMGVDYKEWIAFDPCPICSQNTGKVVAMDKVFTSGHLRPPAHPNCRCALAPALSPGREKQLKKTATTSPTGKGPSLPSLPKIPKGTTPKELTPAQITQKAETDFIKAHAADTRTEHGLHIGRNGETLLEKTGTIKRIEYSANEMKTINKQALGIHNHPSGSPFSPDDIMFAINTDADKIMVASQKYKYTLTPPTQGRYSGGLKFHSDWEYESGKIMDTASHMTGSLSERQAWGSAQLHKALTELTNKNGWTYTREVL